MKFFAAVTKAPLVLKNVDGNEPREFPAGIVVSATPAGDDRWHLNHNPAEFETWDGYATADQLDLGEVIATANE